MFEYRFPIMVLSERELTDKEIDRFAHAIDCAGDLIFTEMRLTVSFAIAVIKPGEDEDDAKPIHFSEN